MVKNQYQINTKNYNNICFRLSSTLLYFERNHYRDSEKLEVDVFADFWSLAFLPEQSSPIKILYNGKEILFRGPVYFYIPPHSIIKWILPQGNLVWYALMSTQSLPTSILHPVAILSAKSISELTNENIITRWLNSYSTPIPIGVSSAHKNTVAQKIKSWIDDNYQTNLLISDLSFSMKVSNSYLTKEFKKYFDISPVEYRSKKRIYKAMQIFMFSPVRANRVAYEVGFSEYSQFKKNFLHLMNATPKEFKINLKLK